MPERAERRTKMKRTRLLLVLAVFVVILTLQTTAQATRVIGPYARIYEGVEYAEGTDTTPRLMKAFVMRVDLWNPAVQLFASHDNANGRLETDRETPPAFLISHGLKVAMNASFYAGGGKQADIWGVLISNGTVVSGPYAAPFNSVLMFTQAKVPNIITTSTVPTGQYTAVAGAEIILQNGQIVIGPGLVNPTTGYGISQDKRYLIMMVVDGRQPGWSEGCNYIEQAQWMLDFGAWDAVHMDGGGSSCMAKNVGGNAVVINRPCDGSPRAVGASLGIITAW